MDHPRLSDPRDHPADHDQSEDIPDFKDDEWELFEDDEAELRQQELAEYNDSMSRSHDEGWFYDDSE
jgi:hypothetical protein